MLSEKSPQSAFLIAAVPVLVRTEGRTAFTFFNTSILWKFQRKNATLISYDL